MKNYFLCLLIFLSSLFCAGTKPDIAPSELPKTDLITQISSVSPAENAENVPIWLDTIKIIFKRQNLLMLPGFIRVYSCQKTGINSVFCDIIPGKGFFYLILAKRLKEKTEYFVTMINPLYMDKSGHITKMAGAKKWSFVTGEK